MKDPVDRAVRAIAQRNSFALVWAQFGFGHLIMLGGLALLSLYQRMSLSQFLILAGVSQALVLIDNLISILVARRVWRPVRVWEQGARDPESTEAAWRALVTLPLEFFRRTRQYPVVLTYLPFIAFATYELALPWYSFFILAAVGTVVLAYEMIVRYFTIEVVVRPVLERIARELPVDFVSDVRGLPLRWRLLAVAPIINVITGVVVAGLSANGEHTSLSQLGVSWLIAVGVSFTISLELVILSARSLASAIADLRRATERLRAGDFSARIPVVAADETGAVANSFNLMAEGLDERERLRSAFGAYVDPDVAERVLREGTDLAGEELEVTVLFLDIRGFTEITARSNPRDTVALLNGLWSLVVPVLHRHGGQANKFIGDGLLAVFGAPQHATDHAERAVTAALEIARTVHEHYQDRVGVGIGVNTGVVVAGSVGGGGRVEFTVIGDAVNLASRVENATRETGDDVLITGATRARLPRGRFAFARRDHVAIRDRPDGLELWAPSREVRAMRAPSQRPGATTVSD